jgi:parvulin-like peptidyl-prolyl isomerase
MKPHTLFLTLASALAGATATRAEVLERVIVKVNGEIVTQSEFEARQVAAIQAGHVPAGQIEGYLRQNNARILQEAIDELLLVQKAEDLGVKIRPEYTSDVIENIKKENNIASDEALRDQLRREGLTLDEMRRNIERSILRRQVVAREVEAKVQVSEAEVRAEYEKRRQEFTRPAELHLQEIVVGPDALALAQELAARARAGEDFSALAREHSKAASRGQGGELGTLAITDLHADIRKAAAGLAPGGVSDPVAAPEGFRILRVVERSEEGLTPYDSAKAELRKHLGEERMSQEYEGYLKALRDKAIIDVRVREVPLSVSVPTATSILEPPEPGKEVAPAAGGAAAAAAAESEFVTSPQSAPERIAPGATDTPQKDPDKGSDKPPTP